MVDKLVAEAQSDERFADKPPGYGRGRGPPRHPLLIKVLAALRCLAKGVDVGRGQRRGSYIRVVSETVCEGVHSVDGTDSFPT